MIKILFFLFINIITLASNKLEFRIENDVLVSDGYYTSGLDIKYSYLLKRDTNGEKNYWNIVFGQKIFTPENIALSLDKKNEYERPYASWLYIGLEKEKIYNNKSTLIYSFLLGLTGERSQGERCQKLVHRIIDSQEPQGWSSQIEEIIGFQFNMSYTFKNFQKKRKNNKKLIGEFTWAYEIGNIFMNLKISEKLKLKYLKKESEKSDFHVFIMPSLKLNFYDATIQGAMHKNNSNLTRDIKNLVGKISLGINKAIKNLEIDYSINFHTPEVEGVSWNKKDFFYHSLYFKVLF